MPRRYALLGVGLVAACAGQPAPSSPGPDARPAPAADRAPYASTYAPRPFRPVLIRNATVLTAAGPELRNASVLLQDGKVAAVGTTLDFSLREARRRSDAEIVAKALAFHNGNLSQTAHALGISRPALYKLIRRHGARALLATGGDPSSRTASPDRRAV